MYLKLSLHSFLSSQVTLKEHALVGFTPLTYRQVEVLVDEIATGAPHETLSLET